MTDCCSTPGLLPFEQALSDMLGQIKPITETLSLPIEQAVNYVLAENIVSPLNVPGHDNSAMDGYAFSYASLAAGKALTLIGKSMAGAPFKQTCLAGQCVRIMTGAKLPQGCDTVEMQENCQVETDAEQKTVVKFSPKTKLSQHVRYAGEDIKSGAQVLAKGKRLTALDIGLLASLGVVNLVVYRPLTVALIATGDELKKPGESLTDGDIYETNSFVISAMLSKLNINVLNFGVIKDDYDAISLAFSQANEQVDAIISSGGVSVGDADYTKSVLDDLGEIGFWKIAMKPGKPFAFGKLSNSIFFGLPGNPVSALVTFHQLALIALVKLQHAQPLQRTQLQAKVTDHLRKSPGRMDFQRGYFSVNEQGESVVASTGAQGSGILSSLSDANCYIVLPAAQGKVEVGEQVNIQLFDQFMF